MIKKNNCLVQTDKQKSQNHGEQRYSVKDRGPYEKIHQLAQCNEF